MTRSFDRRKGPIRDHVAWILQRRKWRARHVASHLVFRVNGTSIAYCYIRKNACTVFKRMLCETSEYRGYRNRFATDLEFLFQFHSIRTLSAITPCDHRIFVYRDPVQRAVSVFVDKFVLRRGNDDLFKNYASVTGLRPEDATFDLFVSRYLSQPATDLDPHCVSQCQHLMPILYTHAIALSSLSNCIRGLVGPDLAARFFASKVNEIPAPRFDNPCHDLPSEVLHRKFSRQGQVPANASLLTNQNIRALRKIYQDDVVLLDRLSVAETGAPESFRRLRKREVI